MWCLSGAFANWPPEAELVLCSVSVGRLEERELELKKEYNSLHQRHTEVRGRGRMEGEEGGKEGTGEL